MKIPIKIEIEIDDQLLEDCCNVLNLSRDEFTRRFVDSIKESISRHCKTINELLARLIEDQEIILQNPNIVIGLLDEYIEKIKNEETEELRRRLGV